MGAGGIINDRAGMLLGILNTPAYSLYLSPTAASRIAALTTAGSLSCSEDDVKWMSAVIKSVTYGC